MRSWLCLMLVVALGCGGKHDEPVPGVASGAAPVPGVASGAAPVGNGIPVLIDDKVVATVTQDQVSTWPRLVTLLPMSARRLGQWLTISMKDAKGATTELGKPSMKYPDTVPVLFPDGGGTSFGMFDGVDLANHGAPKMRVDQVNEIRITLSKDSSRGQNETGDGAGTDPNKITLSIKPVKGDVKVIEGKTLLAMTLQPMPGAADAHGWTLTTILKTAGITSYQRLLLTDAGGTNLTIDKADFDDKTTIPFVKLNRKGNLRFTILKQQGEGWQKSGDLSSLASIEVIK